MKKSTIVSLIALLNGEAIAEPDTIKAELEAELSRGKAKADANRAVYAEMHDKVMEVLGSTTNPVTAQELADETGFARGKIVYGLTNYWSDEVVKDTSGKSTTYRLA